MRFCIFVVRKIEILNEQQFVKYTTDSYATTFSVTAAEPCRRWEFDMEIDNIKVHWTGVFTKRVANTCII